MKNNSIEYIDFAKGFAILTIVFYHYTQPFINGWLGKAIMLGGTGVHLFFLLSGFGLGLGSENFKLRIFFQKRFWGVLFPYYISIIFISALGYCFGLRESVDWYALCGHFLLFKMFDEEIIGSYGYHFWFVSTIFQFYILFPGVVWFHRISGNRWFFIFSIFLSIIYWLVIAKMEVGHLRVFNSSAFQFFWEFSLGMIFAKKFMVDGFKFWDQRLVVLMSCAFLGISTMAIMALEGGTLGKIFNDIPASIGFCSFVAMVYALFRQALISRFVIYVGKFSFELYLLHMIVFLMFDMLFSNFLFDRLGLVGALGIVFPFALLFSVFFANLIQFLRRISVKLLLI